MMMLEVISQKRRMQKCIRERTGGRLPTDSAKTNNKMRRFDMSIGGRTVTTYWEISQVVRNVCLLIVK